MASYTTSTKLSVESNIDFTLIDQDLRGKVETVVSNSTLANVAKQHSLCLRSLVMDMSMAKAALEKFKSDWSIVTDLQVHRLWHPSSLNTVCMHVSELGLSLSYAAVVWWCVAGSCEDIGGLAGQG